ncbi:hypothetical protein [Leptospira interrogans]|nr:hypothetical protein [Leptospira interrogans]
MENIEFKKKALFSIARINVRVLGSLGNVSHSSTLILGAKML